MEVRDAAHAQCRRPRERKRAIAYLHESDVVGQRAIHHVMIVSVGSFADFGGVESARGQARGIKAPHRRRVARSSANFGQTGERTLER